LRTKIGIIVFLILTAQSIVSDTVVLKNGKTYENVKTILLKNSVRFSFEKNLLTFSKSEVNRIRLRPVILKPPTNETERLEYEAERIRVAEALQNNTDWEMTSTSKQSVAVIKLLPGSGVSLAEVESVTNLIRTSLVKTNLFSVIDTSAFESSAKKKDCPAGKKDCVEKLPESIKVNKIITGTLTKLGKKYIINGNALDGKDNHIVFAEKASASSVEKLEEASEYFAKKVAGGLMEDWNEALNSKEAETYANIPYIWRSALLPGLGQWKFGKDKEDSFATKKGFGYGAASFILLANVFYNTQKLAAARETYDTNHRNFFLTPSGSGLELIAFSLDNSSFSDLQNASKDTKLAAGLFIGFYIFNIADAFFLGRPIFGAKKSSSGLFFLPSKSILANGQKEDFYTLGIQFQL
jgi:TolB-like protein